MKVCPGNLICSDVNKKAIIHEASKCWGCTACMKECHVQAITLHLNTEANHHTHQLSLKNQDDKILWTIKKNKKTTLEVFTNKKEGNSY